MIDLNKFITLHVVQGSMELSLMQNQPVYLYTSVLQSKAHSTTVRNQKLQETYIYRKLRNSVVTFDMHHRLSDCGCQRIRYQNFLAESTFFWLFLMLRISSNYKLLLTWKYLRELVLWSHFIRFSKNKYLINKSKNRQLLYYSTTMLGSNIRWKDKFFQVNKLSLFSEEFQNLSQIDATVKLTTALYDSR